MNQGDISEEVKALKLALGEVVRDCDFGDEPEGCILGVIDAGELDIAFEIVTDNIAEYEPDRFSLRFRERLAAIRRRLDVLPPGCR